MRFVECSLPTPAENLAYDEALLEWCAVRGDEEVLRCWQADRFFVVLGLSGRIREEVRVDRCAAAAIPILRRCSGGGTVLQGPGCLNYALVLSTAARPELKTIPGANRAIMEVQRRIFASRLGPGVRVEGITDLTLDGRKFSGNAQRRGRGQLLFHGSCLLSLDLERMEEWLPIPQRHPAYRGNRRHRDFVQNLGRPAAEVIRDLRQGWNVGEGFDGDLSDLVERLVRDRYARPEWNARR
jgi:lipoate-protein ligase A